MKRSWMVLVLLLLLGGCHYPWYSMFRTTPERKDVTVEKTPDAQPERKRGKKYRIVIRKRGMVALPEVQEVPRDE